MKLSPADTIKCLKLAGKPIATASMTERQFQDLVIALARQHGWKVAHFRHARVKRDGKDKYETPVGADGKGWPDLCLVRETLIFAELKSEKGKVSDAQEAWKKRLKVAGQVVCVWRPSNLNEIENVLKART